MHTGTFPLSLCDELDAQVRLVTLTVHSRHLNHGISACKPGRTGAHLPVSAFEWRTQLLLQQESMGASSAPSDPRKSEGTHPVTFRMRL